MQCEATFVNKMAKIRQETEAAIHEVSFQARFQVFQYACIFRLLLVHCAANGLFFQPRYYIYKTLSDYRGYQMR